MRADKTNPAKTPNGFKKAVKMYMVAPGKTLVEKFQLLKDLGFDGVELDAPRYESHRETLDAWALDELLGHYVNYRKQVSPNFDHLLPKDGFRLFAIAARFPEGLARQTTLREVQSGVFEVVWGTTTIRIVVAGRLPRTEPNALLHLFSASEPLLQYGREIATRCRSSLSGCSSLPHPSQCPGLSLTPASAR